MSVYVGFNDEFNKAVKIKLSILTLTQNYTHEKTIDYYSYAA